MEGKFLNIIGIVAIAGAIIFAHNITKEKTLNAGIKIENMDTSVKAGEDFYNFATRGWQTAHPIPDDYSRFGAFEVLRNTNLERTRQIAENDSGKIGTMITFSHSSYSFWLNFVCATRYFASAPSFVLVSFASSARSVSASASLSSSR